MSRVRLARSGDVLAEVRHLVRSAPANRSSILRSRTPSVHELEFATAVELLLRLSIGYLDKYNTFRSQQYRQHVRTHGYTGLGKLRAPALRTTTYLKHGRTTVERSSRRLFDTFRDRSQHGST